MESHGPPLQWASSMNHQRDFDHNGSHHGGYVATSGSNPPPNNNNSQLSSHHQSGQIIQVCTDVKPRLTKEQHDLLERHFQIQHKPTTSTKKGFADDLGVPLDKINNWFQNRRAKVKQDMKKQLNAYTIYSAQMAQHQQYLPPPQPLPSSTPQEFLHPVTEYTSDSASTDEGNPNLFSHQPDFTSTVPSIIGASQPHSTNSLISMNTSGYSMAEPILSSSVTQENGLIYGPPLFGQEFGTQDFTLGCFNGYSGPFAVSSDSLAYPPYLQTSAPAVQAMPALSESQSITPLSSSASPHTMPSLTSAYSRSSLIPNRKDSVSEFGGSPDESLESPEQGETRIGWLSEQVAEHIFYQDSNPSAPALDSCDQLVHSKGSTDIFARRNSSTTALADSMNTVDITNSSPTLKQPAPSAGLAARRQKARPANIGLAALRSASYSTGPISPGALTAPEQSLRRIRSGGVMNGGRISKPMLSSGQRSPLHFNFADSAASPKFARNASNAYSISTQCASSSAVSATGSLAPPTPLTPGDFGRFPSWQSHGVVKTYPPSDNTNGVSVSWSGSAVNDGLHVNVSSPPETPLDVGQMAQLHAHAVARDQALYRDAPPQSAPATQQSFAPTAMMPQSRSMFHLHDGHGNSERAHFRRPSLPDTTPHFESQMQWSAVVPLFNTVGNLEMSNPMHFNYHNQQYADQNQMTQNMQQYSQALQESMVKPDFPVHEFMPPQMPVGIPSPPRSDSAPKMYQFSNAGPKDYEAPSIKA
ncbi:hypothetical protein EJ08DRAFT_322246 [Tothia fuscella]|uniref:Homeobox domain-containing protein n=1 Tax=Tothia fuscella TaxID=1048955 RepID=A0A9P4NNI5_9PEZI|nr:hypothetical protein EJ08DRAFT_322246 [Tothia fuscella]